MNSKGNCNSIFLKVSRAGAPRTAAESRVPLEPHRAIIRGLLLLSSSLRQALPARSLMTDSSFKMRAWKPEEGDRKKNTILPSLFPHTARIANPLLPSLIGFRILHMRDVFLVFEIKGLPDMRKLQRPAWSSKTCSTLVTQL